MPNIITQTSKVASWYPHEDYFFLNLMDRGGLSKVQRHSPVLNQVSSDCIFLVASDDLILAHEMSSLKIVLLKTNGEVVKIWNNMTYAGSETAISNKFSFRARNTSGIKSWYSIDTKTLELEIISNEFNQMVHFFDVYGAHYEKENISFFEVGNPNKHIAQLQTQEICPPRLSNFFTLKYIYLGDYLTLIQYSEESISLYSLEKNNIAWVKNNIVFLNSCHDNKEHYLLDKKNHKILTLNSWGLTKSESQLVYQDDLFIDRSIVIFRQKALVSTRNGKIVVLDLDSVKPHIIKTVTIEEVAVKRQSYLVKVTNNGFLGVHTGDWAGAQILFYDFDDFVSLELS